MSSEFLVKPKAEVLNDELQTNWYIFYTYPRAEKVVKNELDKREYEVFLPTRKELKIWKNRQKKWIDLVLFPGYIFVKTQQHEIFNILKTPKVVNFISCGGKPSFLKPKEIQCIRMMVNLEQDLIIDSKFYEGEKVRIISGPLIGYEGILVDQKGKTQFGIQLKEINHMVLIDVCISKLEKV